MTISDDVRAADSIAKIANEMAHYDWVMPPPIEIWAQRLQALPSHAELERDAGRYRWLRNGNSIQIFGLHEKWITSHRLDRIVDVAMHQENK